MYAADISLDSEDTPEQKLKMTVCIHDDRITLKLRLCENMELLDQMVPSDDNNDDVNVAVTDDEERVYRFRCEALGGVEETDNTTCKWKMASTFKEVRIIHVRTKPLNAFNNTTRSRVLKRQSAFLQSLTAS